MFQKNIGTNLVTSMVDTNWYRYDINYFDYSSNWHTPPPQLPTIITVTITINTAFAITTIHPNQHPTQNDYLYLKTNKFRLKKCNHKMNFLHIKLDISITLFFYHYHIIVIIFRHTILLSCLLLFIKDFTINWKYFTKFDHILHATKHLNKEKYFSIDRKQTPK